MSLNVDDDSVLGNQDDGDEEEGDETPEMKYVPPVKTEVEGTSPTSGSLTEDDVDDPFLSSWNSNIAGNPPGDECVEETELDTTKSSEVSKNKRQTTQTARRGGGRKHTYGPPKNEREALRKKNKKSQMTAEEKEEQREKWKTGKRLSRQKAKEYQQLTDLVACVVVEDLQHSTLPKREARSRKVVKKDPESADECGDELDDDYQVEEQEDDEDYGPKKRKTSPKNGTTKAKKSSSPSVKASPRGASRTPKKKVSEMTEKEQEAVKAKWREEARLKRARQREKLKPDEKEETLSVPARRSVGGHKKKVSEMTEEKQEAMKLKWREEAKLKRARKREASAKPTMKREESISVPKRRSAGGRKKRVSEMTEEEREAMKAKWREEARIKRALQRESMDPIEREEALRIQRERRREQRAMAKMTMTEEEKTRGNEREKERKKAKRALMTPEQRKEETQKATLRRIERQAQMTEDERKMHQMSVYLQSMARLGRMTPEEIEARKKKTQEYAKRRRAQMTAEELERKRLYTKQYRANMSPERKEQFLARLRQGHQRRMDLMREDPQKWEEMKEKWRHDRLTREKRVKEVGTKFVRRRKDPTTGEFSVSADETPEQRLERRKELKRLTQKKTKLKKKLAMQKLLDSGMTMDEIQQQVETPEKRERRLIKKRITKAMRTLRQRLETSGASKEQIEGSLKELNHTYQPTYAFRPYRARPDCWKPVTESDLALIAEGLEKKVDVPSSDTSKQVTASVYNSTPSGAPGRRGRPPKENLTLQQSTSSHQATTSTTTLEATTVPTELRSGASSCSYVSAGGTPEPFYGGTRFPHTSDQQYVSPQNYTPSQYHFPQNQMQHQVYPHQQQQVPVPQGYINPFQSVMDNMFGYQRDLSGGTGGTSYQPQVAQSTNSHHHEGDYASSYDNNSPLPAGSPPASPLMGNDDNDSGDNKDFGDFSYDPPPQSSTESVRRRGRPRKDEPPRPKKPVKIGGRTGPRGSRKLSKGGADIVCDECGNSYKRAYLSDHKRQFHNVNFNYKDHTCRICGEYYKLPRLWYVHFARTHAKEIKSREPVCPIEKPQMCDLCGLSFRIKYNLEKHKYYLHGEGMKKENWPRCPVCPTDKRFKETVSLYNHLKKVHPGYNRGGHDCYRCDQTFPNEKTLGLHVKEEHPDSYFPCEFCIACRFTRRGLNFHYFRCPKVDQETRERTRKQEGVYSVDRIKLPCEVCRREVGLFSLTRHYWEMHSVKEDKFKCHECAKEFRVREFWAVHLEEKHLTPVEEISKLVRVMNVTNREGLVIKNPSGVHDGVPGNTPNKAAAARKRAELGHVKRGPKKGTVVPRPKRGGKRVLKRSIVVTAEEEEKEDEEVDKSKKKTRKPRKQIKVVAEEEEEEEEDDELMMEKGSSVPYKSKEKPTKTSRKQIIVEAEEEEEEDEPETKTAVPSPRKQRRVVGRKPDPKSKTRPAKKQVDSEEEEEEWRGSEEEDDDDVYTPSSHRTSTNRHSAATRSSTRQRNSRKKVVHYRNSDEEEESDDEDELLVSVVKQEVKTGSN